jgi:hypothetical protein
LPNWPEWLTHGLVGLVVVTIVTTLKVQSTRVQAHIRLISTVHYRCDWLLGRPCPDPPRALMRPCLVGCTTATQPISAGANQAFFGSFACTRREARHTRFIRDKLTRAKHPGTRQPIRPYIFPPYISRATSATSFPLYPYLYRSS